MTLAEQIAAKACTSSPQIQQQVLDFMLFLKQKEQRLLEADMDTVISENLPALKELAK